MKINMERIERPIDEVLKLLREVAREQKRLWLEIQTIKSKIMLIEEKVGKKEEVSKGWIFS